MKQIGCYSEIKFKALDHNLPRDQIHVVIMYFTTPSMNNFKFNLYTIYFFDCVMMCGIKEKHPDVWDYD